MTKNRAAEAPGLPLDGAPQPEPASEEQQQPVEEAVHNEAGDPLDRIAREHSLQQQRELDESLHVPEAESEPAPPEPIRAEDLVPEPDRLGEWVVTLLPPDEAYLRGVTPELLEAMCSVMEAVETIRKDSKNTYSNYQYASVDAFFSMIRPLLAKNKLVPIPQLEEVTTTPKHMVQRFAMFLLHTKGGRLGPLRAEAAAPIDMGPQAYGGAQAYAEKFWLRGLFLISAEEPGEDVDSRPKTPLDQRRDPRPAPRQQPAQQRQQRAPQGAGGAIPGYVPSDAPPPDDADAPGGRSRGEEPPRERSPFASEHKKLSDRLKAMGISVRSCIDSFGAQSIEQLTPAQLREANQILDDTQRDRDARAVGGGK